MTIHVLRLLFDSDLEILLIGFKFWSHDCKVLLWLFSILFEFGTDTISKSLDIGNKVRDLCFNWTVVWYYFSLQFIVNICFEHDFWDRLPAVISYLFFAFLNLLDGTFQYGILFQYGVQVTLLGSPLDNSVL